MSVHLNNSRVKNTKLEREVVSPVLLSNLAVWQEYFAFCVGTTRGQIIVRVGVLLVIVEAVVLVVPYF